MYALRHIWFIFEFGVKYFMRELNTWKILKNQVKLAHQTIPMIIYIQTTEGRRDVLPDVTGLLYDDDENDDDHDGDVVEDGDVGEDGDY